MKRFDLGDLMNGSKACTSGQSQIRTLFVAFYESVLCRHSVAFLSRLILRVLVVDHCESR